MKQKIIFIALLLSCVSVSAQSDFDEESSHETVPSFFQQSGEDILQRNSLVKSQDITDEIKEALEKDNALAQEFRAATYNRFRTGNTIKKFNYSGQILKEFINYRNGEGNNLMSAYGGWQSLGPYEISNFSGSNSLGRLNAIEAAPNDTNILYVGAAGGGLWKSSDAGLNWTCLTDGLPINGVTDIAIDPVNPSVIYILTGDQPSGDNPSAGVFKTYDGGATWYTTGLVFDFDEAAGGNVLKINPDDHNKIYAGMGNGYYYSQDAGVTWTHSYSTTNVTSIEFKPGNGQFVILAGTTSVGGNVIVRSSNWGQTFVQSITPIQGSKIKIAVTPANPNIVFATDISVRPGSPFWKHTVFKSSNGGVTFSNTMIYNVTLDSLIGIMSGAKMAFYASRTDSTVVYVGGITLNKLAITSPSSATLSYISGNKHADIMEMEVVGSRTYLATDGGLFYAYNPNDANQVWENVSNGLNISQITGFGGTEADDDLFVYGTWDNGIFSMDDDVATGEIGNCDGFNGKIAASNNNYWYSSCNGNLWRKIGSGAWSWINGSAAMNGEGVASIAVDPTNPDVIYTIGQRAYKTIDGGNTWVKLNNPDSTVYHEKIYCAPSVFNSKLYTINDAGQVHRRYISTWTDITYNLPTSVTAPARKVTALAISTMNSNLVYATVSGYLDGNKVFRFNGINSWVNISGSLPNVNVQSIVYDNNGSNGLYIGTDIGVFYKDDLLADWIPFMNGMPHIEATEFYIRYSDNSITAATYGRGLWKSQRYSACTPFLNVPLPSGPAYIGFWAYQSSDSMNCSVAVASGAGNELRIQAGTEIDLMPGCEAYRGSEFSAAISSCATYHSSPRLSSGVLLDGIAWSPQVKTIVPASEQTKFTVIAPEDISVTPNPFTNEINFRLRISGEANIRVEMMDVLGKKVADVFEQSNVAPGVLNFQQSTEKLANGIYLVKITCNENVVVKKMVKG